MAIFDELSLALALQSCAFLCLDRQIEATKVSAAAREAARLAADSNAALDRIQKLEARVKPLPSGKDST